MLSRSDIRRSFAFEETEISSSEAEEEEEFLFDEEDEIMEVEVDEEARDDEEDEDDGDVVVLDKNKGLLLSKHNSSTTTAPTSSQSVNTLTKEEQIISGNFDKNQGRLPWPVSNGFISGHYGVQPHPILRHVTTNNKGIYIQTPSNGSARAIFEGIVTQRFSIPGSNNAVIIKHGAFRTVYANLTQISVKEGDKVSAKQVIGKIYTDDENDNKTELYFQIWKDKVLQNPENWLTK